MLGCSFAADTVSEAELSFPKTKDSQGPHGSDKRQPAPPAIPQLSLSIRDQVQFKTMLHIKEDALTYYVAQQVRG